jgi:pantoate--beta-alanine ligase
MKSGALREITVAATASALAKALRTPRRQGKRVGFVPTMGALHEGHLSLVRRARRECQVVVVSIFVNPTQFGPQEDYRKYPRVLRTDLKALGDCPPDVVFYPGVRVMYPLGDRTRIRLEGGLVENLEGRFRPGHFGGVATVVAKLFNLVRPDRAYFGMKDYQQFRVVQAMAKDLLLPVQVVGCPIVRESDGLALSSRNRYLSIAERAAAPALYRALRGAWAEVEKGETSGFKVEAEARRMLEKNRRFKVQYLAVADPATLDRVSRIRGPVVIAAALFLGKTRLIDNLEAHPPAKPLLEKKT